MRRWMRRRRTTVTAAVVAALMALAGLGIVLAVQSQANRDLRKANTRERARFELAMEAIKTFHTGVSEDLLLKQKEFTELRTKLLGEATDLLRQAGAAAGKPVGPPISRRTRQGVS